MTTQSFSMFLLEITEEDLAESARKSNLPTVAAVDNTIADSLWQHPTISSYLSRPNSIAVDFINDRRIKVGDVQHFRVVTHHLIKRMGPILRFLKDEMANVLMNKTSGFQSSSQFMDFMEATDSIFGCVDDLDKRAFTQSKLDLLRKDSQLKGFFHLWLLMYTLGKKEKIEMSALVEARSELRKLLEDWRI